MSSSIEELKEKLIEEARARAREILRKAEEEARRIVEDAEKKWREMAEKEKTRIVEEAKTKAQTILSEAKRQARIVLSNAKNELLNQIFSEVENTIRERRGIDIESSLRNLLEEALIYIEKPSKVIAHPRDREIIERLLREKGLTNIEIVESNDISGGLILESLDGKRVDNSYDTRLERARTTLAPLVNKELWG